MRAPIDRWIAARSGTTNVASAPAPLLAPLLISSLGDTEDDLPQQPSELLHISNTANRTPQHLQDQLIELLSSLFPLICTKKNGLDTKVEKSRKQLKERKNRTKKIRGVKKVRKLLILASGYTYTGQSLFLSHCYTMCRPRLEMLQRLGRRNEMLWILWLLHAGSKSEEWSYAAAFFI
ncbi:uncharacterized protein LOC114285639 [Camellia sinensis]|uniref:uncharacterized protein LOC114285639 n=1 Tax=Camellia sinensis TaxID=4442 RepID=UPI001035F88E|nr:uncharacterized protein LOC114285639 [Camellia sinensis]